MNVSSEPAGRGRSVDLELNLVPFIDMMSCLVAFLLITAVWSDLAQLPVEPAGRGGESTAAQPRLALLLAADAAWIGGAAPRRIDKVEGEFDWPAIGATLAELGAAGDAIEIAAEDGTPYQAIVSAMDLAIAGGLPDLGYVDPASLSVRFSR